MELVKKIEVVRVVKVVLIALLGTLLLTISAKIKIPFYPVPMTMQTFVVLFLGITLGPKIGLLSVSLYLIEGIFGLPVFANSPEKGIGLIYFTGPTMGYLIGFLVSVYLVGLFKFTYRINSRFSHLVLNFIKNFFKLLFCVSFIYVLGLIWLGFLIGWDKPIFKFGAEPFLLAEIFKILLLSIIAGNVQKLKKFI